MKTFVQPLLDTVENGSYPSTDYGNFFKREILYELEKEKRKWIYTK